jgi:hypothetical protein
MFRKLSATFTIALLLSVCVPNAQAAPKLGGKCLKLGESVVVSASTFTCSKSGKSFVWSKATSQKTKRDVYAINSTDGGYLDNILGGPCAPDPLVPTEWSAMEQFSIKRQGCAGQLRVAKYTLGRLRPVSTYQKAEDFSQITPCKIGSANSRSSLSQMPDNWRMDRAYSSPNTNIQLIPIFAEDTEAPKNSPRTDYYKYLKFIKDWIENSSDFGSNVNINIPDKYIKFPNKIAPYGLQHPVNWDTPGHVRFNSDVIAAVDSAIDFKGANIGIVVAPPGTDAAIMQQAALGSFNTNEGKVGVGFSEFGDIPSNPYGSNYAGLTHPFWWIHESYHAGFGLDDRYGDTKFDINTEHGMGWWTMMTPWGGDLSIWEKWILGFVRDSQIQCASNNPNSVHWIAPSSVNTQESKAVVIPVSSTKVVVAESIRPAGLYYKIPQYVQGVLVYEIDLTNTNHGMGMKLSLPTNRVVSNWEYSYKMFLGGAPLRKGDITTTNGIKITVVESGTFGDVIKVSKA